MSAKEVLLSLIPDVSQSVLDALEAQLVLTDTDLAVLDKEDLRELGLRMAERSRVMSWAERRGGEAKEAPFGHADASPGPKVRHARGGTSRHHPKLEPSTSVGTCDDVEGRLRVLGANVDFWCSTVAASYEAKPEGLSRASQWVRHLQSLTEMFEGQDEPVAGECRAMNVREAVLEQQFDFTRGRLQEVIARHRAIRTEAGLDVEIRSAEGLGKILGHLGFDDLPHEQLAAVFEAVTGGRCSKDPNAPGLLVQEFELAFSRLSLARLLGSGPGSVSEATPSGRLTVLDIDSQPCTARSVTGRQLLDFFFGHRPSPGTNSSPAVRWVHVRGCHLALVLALTIKYRLHPLGVEGILDQSSTTVGIVEDYVIAFIDHLRVVGSDNGYLPSCDLPVDVRGRYVAIVCARQPRFDTLITIVQPSRSFHEDWPRGSSDQAASGQEGYHSSAPASARTERPQGTGGQQGRGQQLLRVDSFLEEEAADLWVKTLRQRVQVGGSRVRGHRASFLAYQVIDLCADDLVGVVRAYAGRLTRLERELPSTGIGLWHADPLGTRGTEVAPRRSTHGLGPPPPEWLEEVTLSRLQLAVVARRLKSVRNTVRRLEGLASQSLRSGVSLANYFQDVVDHLEGAMEDVGHLVERCEAMAVAYEQAMDQERARQEAAAQQKEQERHALQEQHAQRLNDTLFVLTVATAIFAPVQFLAGVYGMNFVREDDGRPSIPELLWPHGYRFFWMVISSYLLCSSAFAAGLFRYLRQQAQAPAHGPGAGASQPTAAAPPRSKVPIGRADVADAYYELKGGPPEGLPS